MISHVGGLIAAANQKLAFPLRQIGSISAIKRIVLLFQQAGVFPIVVVTGSQEDEVRYQLSASGVVFIPGATGEAPEMFDSVRTGLEFLQDKSEKVVFTPVNVPMFSLSTLRTLIKSNAPIAVPSFQQKAGHPIMLYSDVIPDILGYCGNDGLRGAMAAMENRRKFINVDDSGILYTVHDNEQIKKHLEENVRQLSQPIMKFSMEREAVFFNARTKLLLLLISHTSSVRSASELMAISYSTAWDMLNNLEQELGQQIVKRKHGGSGGGRTKLTAQGYRFLQLYQHMEENVLRYAESQFDIVKNDFELYLEN